MENGITGEALISVIGMVIGVGSLIVSILVFNASVKERHSKSAAEQAEIAIKLETFTKTLDEIKDTVEDLRTDRAEDHAAIATLETKYTGLEGRVDSVETDLKELRRKMHDLHSN